MEKILKYSVLRYSPSTLSGERINLGILFSEESTGMHSFYYTKNLNRIKSFDDELDKTALKELLIGISKEVEGEWNNTGFDIQKFTKYYINDFKFDRIQAITYETIEKIISELQKVYFRFDFEKNDRPSKNDDQKIIANLIKASGKSLRKNQKVVGAFNEDITYDIATDEYYVKIFDFEDKDLNRCINTAKLWAWNCDHENNKKVFIVYRYSDTDPVKSPKFNIIRDIFKETKAQFISIDEADSIYKSAI